MTTSLVTGASAGLGLEFATRLAARGHDLVVVARDEGRLAAVAADLEHRYGGTVEVLAADLSQRPGCALVEQRLADPTHPVDLLVNNAGFSPNQPFVDGDLEVEQRALDLMVTAVVRLTHAALGGMSARGSGSVVNVASVAGFLPGGTYGAAKAYVISFTEGLAAELRGTGVRVMAVCPGLTHTEFHQRAGIDLSHAPELAWLDASEVVAQALDDLERGTVVCVPSLRYKAVVAASRIAPRRLLAGGYRRARR